MDYVEFLNSKKIEVQETGFEADESKFNKNIKDITREKNQVLTLF